MKILALSLVLAQVQSGACASGDAAAAAQPIYACAVREARRMERSKEPARDIAVAAVSTCRPAVVSFRRLLAECGKPIETVSMLTNRVTDEARDRAITTVISMRAGR